MQPIKRKSWRLNETIFNKNIQIWLVEPVILGELACESLEREETPPSMQAPELAIINWRQLATEQKRYPARILAMMVNNLMFLTLE